MGLCDKYHSLRVKREVCNKVIDVLNNESRRREEASERAWLRRMREQDEDREGRLNGWW